MLIKSKGKGSTSPEYNTSKLSASERIESLLDRNHKYDPNATREQHRSAQQQGEEVLRQAKEHDYQERHK